MQDFLDEIEAAIPALRRYARGLTGNADIADDLVQDCLERAIRKRQLWLPIGPVRAWLYRMLLNIYRNDLRSRRSRGVSVPLEDMTVELATPAPQPGRVALAEMARAIDQLPDEQREALLLVGIDAMSYEEAAKILRIPIGTLMSRLSRARAALRRMTSGDEPRIRAIK